LTTACLRIEVARPWVSCSPCGVHPLLRSGSLRPANGAIILLLRPACHQFNSQQPRNSVEQERRFRKPAFFNWMTTSGKPLTKPTGGSPNCEVRFTKFSKFDNRNSPFDISLASP